MYRANRCNISGAYVSGVTVFLATLVSCVRPRLMSVPHPHVKMALVAMTTSMTTNVPVCQHTAGYIVKPVSIVS